MQWELMGDTVQGKLESDDLWDQPVAMSKDGTTAVIGTPWNYAGTEAIVDVLKFNGVNWIEEARFLGSSEDYFGQSISLSGDGKTVAIGARWSDEGGAYSGHIEIYHQTKDGSWMPKGRKLLGLKAGDWFGDSVSLSKNGNQLAVGSPHSDLNGEDSGSISVYEFDGNDWIQLGETIAGEAAGDEFGTSVSLSANGNIVAGGAPWSYVNGTASGSVTVFQYNNKRRTTTNTNSLRNMQNTQQGEQWIPIGQKLIGQAPNDWFGYSLSVNANGDTVAVGAYNGNYVKVFHVKNEEWNQLGYTLVGENNFGYLVSLAEKTQRLAVGPLDLEGGYVKVYDFDGQIWKQIGDIKASTSEKRFGTSVALSSCGDQVAIGLIQSYGTKDHGCMKTYQLK